MYDVLYKSLQTLRNWSNGFTYQMNLLYFKSLAFRESNKSLVFRESMVRYSTFDKVLATPFVIMCQNSGFVKETISKDLGKWSR